jgi:molecular chaperone DnaK
MRVGIDLGPTDCCIARVDADVRPTLVPDQGNADSVHTPSAVHVFGGGAFVGRTAEQLAECDPDISVVRGVTERLGQTDPVHTDEVGNKWYGEGIAALALKKLRIDAEALGTSNLEGAVIAVPMQMSASQRQALLSAAALAALPVFELVDEPVAVALHYGLDRAPGRGTALVWDLGGTTVDVSLLTCDQSRVAVLKTAGLRDKGGCRIDAHIGDFVLAQFERALGAPLAAGARTQIELRRTAEALKLELMAGSGTSLRKSVMLGGMVVEIQVALADVKPAVDALLDEVAGLSERCLRDGGVAKRDVTRVLLAGGTALLPAAAARAQQLLPQAQVLCREPDRAVACGAAIRASQLGPSATPRALSSELKGVTGFAVGVRTVDATTGRVCVDTLIKENAQLPAKAQKPYYTTRRQQERVLLDFVRVSSLGEAGPGLGQVVVGPLQAERANYVIEVTAIYREDGTIKVEAYDAQTGVEFEQVFGGAGDGAMRRLAAQRSQVRAMVVNGVVA